MRNLGTIIVALLILVLIGAMFYMVWRIPAPAAEGLKVAATGTPDYRVTETLDHGITPQQVVTETPKHRVMPLRGITETPNSSFCSDVLAAVRAVVPLNGVQFASPGGETRSVAVYGVTTGETESRTENGIEFDLARLLYLPSRCCADNDKALRSLWFATGYVDKSGTYFPMNVTDPRGWQAWATRQEAEVIFQQSGKGIRLTLTGFLRGDKEIAWESCEQWSYANPPGICSLGLDLELASHGGSSQFLQSSIAPENWFAFGWAIELNGPDATTPTNAGECVP